MNKQLPEHSYSEQLLTQSFTEGVESLTAPEETFIATHGARCESRTGYAAEMDAAITRLRTSGSVFASRGLVTSTQSKVRARAREMKQRRERMAALWLSIALVSAWAIISVPFLWTGFQWLGGHISLPAYVWQTGFIFAWLMPAVSIAAVALWMRGETAVQS